MEQKTYTFEEAQSATLEYFGGDALAARVWANKYAMKDSAGNIYEETPRDMQLYKKPFRKAHPYYARCTGFRQHTL